MKVRLVVPLAFVLPEMTPVLAARLRPEGSDPPVMDHVYGAAPPVALSVAL